MNWFGEIPSRMTFPLAPGNLCNSLVEVIFTYLLSLKNYNATIFVKEPTVDIFDWQYLWQDFTTVEYWYFSRIKDKQVFKR